MTRRPMTPPAPWWRCMVDGCPVRGQYTSPSPGLSATRALVIHATTYHPATPKDAQ